ncbi:hypothetical protein BJX64DRAFT_246200 [Aspergillus heterothallicus]
MISTIITFPLPNQHLPAKTPFVVKFRTADLVAGSVTNPNDTLYSAPQALHNGKIIGHVHLTIQLLYKYAENVMRNQEAFLTLPDPTEVVFFYTIFGKGDERDEFSVLVETGLPDGFYRVCTMVA